MQKRTIKMKTKAMVWSVMLLCMISCGDDEPTFTSIAGVWTYTTPDGKIGADFELVRNGSGWLATNQVIRIDGKEYKAEILATGLTDTSLGSVRINANDPSATYAYYILFSGATVGSDFRQINVPDVSYTWPFNKTNVLTNVTLSRK